ncbi:TolC family protein [Pseudomonas aeruginosa]|uniref:TolC family protein n=1 Tax=Pseudomonas aeruginosa TaxID=287 RepID=UPI0029C02E0D|nr:TolC family protein [Pseudomonas aeruginosa]
MNRWGLGVLWLVIALPVAASVNPALSPDVPSMAREQGRSVLLSEQVIDLSLSDAVYLGLRNNRGIRSAYLQRIAQKFDLRVAADAFNPKLVVRGDYRANRATEDRTRTSNVSPTATLLGEYGTRFSLAWVKQFRTADEAGRYRSDGLDLTVVQPLLRDAGWDVTTAPLRLARLSEDANRLQLKASVSQTISQVIGAYRELLRAQEQARIAREALARTQELLEVNRAMIRAGRMAEFEIVQTEADVASQELNVEESTNQVDSARLALLQLLALDLSTQIRASDALAATPIEVDRQQAIRTALQQQPEYLQRLIGSRQADLNLVLAKNQRLWDVSLVGGASQIRDRYSEGGGDNSRSWDSYAGVQVEIPIGDLSRRQAEVRAQVDVENQKILIEDARQTLEQNVIDAVRDLGTRWRQYQIAQRATALSRRKLEIEREKLRVGRSSNFQVLSFETDLRNVENTQLNALISFLNAQTQLDLIVGMTLDSWEISLNDH